MATDAVPFTTAGELLLPTTERLLLREKAVEVKLSTKQGCVRVYLGPCVRAPVCVPVFVCVCVCTAVPVRLWAFVCACAAVPVCPCPCVCVCVCVSVRAPRSVPPRPPCA
jgi:hypothetical protein